MNPRINILGLFLFPLVLTACTGHGPVPAVSATPRASPTPDDRPTRPPMATITATATRTPTPSPTPTYTPSPFPTCTPIPANIVYVIDRSVYNDVNPGIELGVWEAIGVLQKALEQRAPAWARYRWRDSQGREHSLAEYIWDASSTQRTSVNPRVLLVTAGMALDWKLPEGKDPLRAISEVGVTLTQHYRAFFFDEALRARYPQVVNPASYALYAFFDYDLEKLQAWAQEYDHLFGEWQPRLAPVMCHPAAENK